MGKIKLAVIGTSVYAQRLTGCIQKNAPEYLEVFHCEAKEDLSKVLPRLQPDILLCEQEIQTEKNLSRQTVQIQLIDDQNLAGEAGGSDQNTKQIDKKIFRYQRGSEILRQVFQIYEQNSKKNLVCRCKTAEIEMTAFYAPCGHELLLPFSVSYAALCSAHTKVLYLNLSEFSGMRILFEDRDGTNFSDLIYGIRQKNERFPLYLQSVLHHAEQFDYVLPPANPKDLYEIQEQDLACLLTLLQQQTQYKKIVWNCGTLNHSSEQIMESCSKIYCLVRESIFGRFRKTEFEQFLRKQSLGKILEKIQFVNPQAGNGIFTAGVDVLTQLQSGSFAAQVRKLTGEVS